MLSNDVINEIENKLNVELDTAKTKPLSGGDINDVYKVVDINGREFVVKVNLKNQFPKMLSIEKSSLEYFRSKNLELNYTEPVEVGETEKHQFLVLKFVQEGGNSIDSQIKLGSGLANQHKVTNDYFGWRTDNYIGSLPQKNDQKNSWQEFYSENRLFFQFKLAFDKGLVDKKLMKSLENFCSNIENIYPKEDPALLHGDLWGGNYFIDTNGDPFLYDPAIYYGHREIDIAMTQLFGGFSSEFLDSYNSTYPLENGWKERILFGQLYPNLVHVNLFGGMYVGAVKSALRGF